MSAEMMTPSVPAAPISLDDIRHKALAIRTEVQDEVQTQVRNRRNQIIAVGAVVLLVALSAAYFVGTRAGRAAAEQRLA